MSIPQIETDRVLRARSVSQSFGPVQALVDVDIEVHPGRVHAIVGENGAGKSTLAKILAGIERADRAEMTLGADRYSPADRADARGRGVDMVPQQLSLVGELSLVENFLLVGRSRWLRRGGARARLADTLALADVQVDLDAPTQRLGQAHRQLGEIVVALADGARLLILDEPTSSLGPVEVGGLFAHIRTLCDRGTAVVLITHRLDEVRDVADEVTVLSHGRRVHHGPAAGLSAAEIARLMVGELVPPPPRAPRTRGEVVLSVAGVSAEGDHGARVSEISLDLRAGEITGLAGVAGSGQALLMDVLAGFVRPTAGEVRLDGRIHDAAGLRRAGVAWIPEERSDALVPSMSAGDTLEVYDSAIGERGARRSRLDRRASHRERLQDFDVRPARPDWAASAFSGGNQQKLLAARELHDGARVVLAYGPTQGLDLRAAGAIRERLIRLAEAGAAVLLASHDLDELLQTADRIAVMFAGRLQTVVPAHADSSDAIGRAMAGLVSDDRPLDSSSLRETP